MTMFRFHTDILYSFDSSLTQTLILILIDLPTYISYEFWLISYIETANYNVNYV